MNSRDRTSQDEILFQVPPRGSSWGASHNKALHWVKLIAQACKQLFCLYSVTADSLVYLVWQCQNIKNDTDCSVQKVGKAFYNISSYERVLTTKFQHIQAQTLHATQHTGKYTFLEKFETSIKRKKGTWSSEKPRLDYGLHFWSSYEVDIYPKSPFIQFHSPNWPSTSGFNALSWTWKCTRIN